MKEVSFACGEVGPSGAVGFPADNPEAVVLMLGNETSDLRRVRTASGEKYISKDKGLSIWLKGTDMTLELPGGATHICALRS
ncbi:MliC family protein [Amaricoccus macauensis]|uniref:MliC family protein n=1 Tax=Amaricoccus macauensis TaxID=57001 RepID=UPI003C7A45DB